MSTITLHELTPSPNNIKIRIALAFKGLDYERGLLEIDAYPGDRSAIVGISGQPRTPVLVHGDTVVYDSQGILRYLDANFRDTPSLFSADFEEFGKIEEWELYARSVLGAGLRELFGALTTGQVSDEISAEASRRLTEATGPIEEALAAGGGYLVGGRLTAADIALAPAVHLGMLDEGVAALHPFLQGMRAYYHLGEGRDRTRAWVRTVLAYDPVIREAATPAGV